MEEESSNQKWLNSHSLVTRAFLFHTLGKRVNAFLIYLFWLRWVFVAERGLSLVVASGGYSSLRCAVQWLLLLRSTGSRHVGFSSCGARAQERRLSSCGVRA